MPPEKSSKDASSSDSSARLESTSQQSPSLVVSRPDSAAARKESSDALKRQETAPIRLQDKTLLITKGSSEVVVGCELASGGRFVSKLETNATSLSNQYFSIIRNPDGSTSVKATNLFAGKLVVTAGGLKGEMTLPDSRPSGSPSISTAIDRANHSPTTNSTSTTSTKPAIGSSTDLYNRLTRDFSRYTQSLGADEKACGHAIAWQACHQEYLQIIGEYKKITSQANSWPPSPQNQTKLELLSNRLTLLLDHYEGNRSEIALSAERGSMPTTATSDISLLKDIPWQTRQNELFPRLIRIYEGIENRRIERSKNPNDDYGAEIAREERFIGGMRKFEEIFNSHRWDNDSKMMSTMLKHWEFAATEFESAPIKKSPSGLFRVADSVSGLKEQVINFRYSGTSSTVQLREQMLSDSLMVPAPLPTTAQLESLLFMDSRFTSIAGPVLPGERSPHFNYADVQALTDKLAGDRIANPSQLAADAIQQLGIDPRSQTARGIRLGLGVEQLTSEERHKLQRAENFVARHPRLNGPIARTVKAGLADAKAGLAEANAGAEQIRSEVRRMAKESLIGALTPISVIPGDITDTTPRTVTENEMRSFQKHAAIVATIGSNDLKAIENASGTKISTFLPRGVSHDFIRFMIGSVTLTDPPTGMPPGVALRIETDPSRPAEYAIKHTSADSTGRAPSFDSTWALDQVKKLWNGL